MWRVIDVIGNGTAALLWLALAIHWGMRAPAFFDVWDSPEWAAGFAGLFLAILFCGRTLEKISCSAPSSSP